MKTSKKILILNAHPDKNSFCAALSEQYLKGAKKVTAEVKLIHLIDLNFNLILKNRQNPEKDLEPDLLEIQKDIKNAEHLVFVYPTWWGTYPALLKGFIDRVFLSGFAYKSKENSLLWNKLLTGKTARIIVTMDTPKWYYYLFYGKPGHNSIKKNILEFCGIKPVKITTLTPIKKSTGQTRNKWLEKIEKLGEKMI